MNLSEFDFDRFTLLPSPSFREVYICSASPRLGPEDGVEHGSASTFKYSLFSYSYEPELFPGLIYRMIKPRIVLLIFVSGKVVLTGK